MVVAGRVNEMRAKNGKEVCRRAEARSAEGVCVAAGRVQVRV